MAEYSVLVLGWVFGLGWVTGARRFVTCSQSRSHSTLARNPQSCFCVRLDIDSGAAVEGKSCIRSSFSPGERAGRYHLPMAVPISSLIIESH